MNQGRIIVITGAPGTGKTTTASVVAKESDLEKSVHMHTDDFYHYYYFRQFQFIGGMKVGEPSADGRGSAPPELAEQQARAGSDFYFHNCLTICHKTAVFKMVI